LPPNPITLLWQVVNCWLIVYTWLQHTDVDVPHLAADQFSYMRGVNAAVLI
jgi:hypothetical protein